MSLVGHEPYTRDSANHVGFALERPKPSVSIGRHGPKPEVQLQWAYPEIFINRDPSSDGHSHECPLVVS